MSVATPTEPYNFDPRWERAVVLLACTRPTFYGSTANLLEPEALGRPEAKLAITAAHAIFRDAGRGPDAVVAVLQRLRRFVNDGRVTIEEVQSVDDYFTAAEEDAIPSEELITSELAPQIQRRLEKKFLVGVVETYRKKGDIGRAATEFAATLGRIGRVDVSLGSRVGPAALAEIAAMRHHERLRTPVIELDGALGGGLPRGSLGVICADTGGGKSMFLSHQGAVSMLAGLFVVAATLEVPRPIWIARVLAAITGIAIDTIVAGDTDEAMRRLEAVSDVLGACLVKDFTPDATTITDIDTWVDECAQREGREPDVVLIDYADRCIPESRQASTYEAMKVVYERARLGAVRRNNWWWTACASKGAGSGKHKKEVLDTDDASDSRHKPRVSDAWITGNPRSGGDEILWHVAKYRHGAAGQKLGPIPHDFACGRVAPVATLGDL